MTDNKKILICQYCKYYPTKADSEYVKVIRQTIQWICNACLTVNHYSKYQCIVLPQTSYLSISSTNILSNLKIKDDKRYFIVIICEPDERRVFYKPQNYEQLEKIFKLDLNLLNSTQKMKEQSQIFKLFHQKIQSFSKFTKMMFKNDQKSLLLSEYKAYILDLYLRNLIENSEITDIQEEIQIQLLLKTNNRIFSFSFRNLNLNKCNVQCQEFVLIFALFSFHQIPSWLVHLYETIIKKHEWNGQILYDNYEFLLVGSNQNQKTSIFLGKSLIKQQITQILGYCNRKQISFKFEQKLEHYDLSPLSSTSFHKFLKLNQQKSGNQTQNLTVFFKQRRKFQINSVSLTDDLYELKQLLLHRRYEENFQQSLQKTIESKIQSSKKIEIIKIVATLKLQNNYSIILYTFNWNKIEKQFLELTLQDPVQQKHIFRQDIELHQKYPIIINKPNPFAKKKKYEEIRLNYQDQQQNQDDYICL